MFSNDPRQRILVIEDDLDTQGNLRDILELDGYEVEIAASVGETMQPRDWASFFAIILDRRLPDGSADSLLPSLRDLAPKAAVIVVTGNADLEGALGVIRHGIADFIPKPIDPDMLRASLARTARLKEMEERSRQDERLATIGRMMASVAHESRNALQRISASTDLLELSMPQDSDAERDLRNIRSAAGDLQAMLEEIRGFAAPIHLQLETVSLQRLWSTAWNHLPGTSHVSQATLIENLETSDLNCRVDAFRLQQVYRNLFENAIASCDPPAVIKISASDIVRKGVATLQVSVQDNGPGIEAKQLPQLFEPFFTTKPEGTGLGLAIVKRIIDAHDGRVYVSEPSVTKSEGARFAEGARFVIELPRTSKNS